MSDMLHIGLYLVRWTAGLALSAASLLLDFITDFSAAFHVRISFFLGFFWYGNRKGWSFLPI